MHEQAPTVTTDVARPALRALADRLGIQSSYLDQTGESLRLTSDATREQLLAAMGYDASTEAAAMKVLRALRRADRKRLIEPVRVVRQWSRTLSRVRVRAPRIDAEAIQWTLTLRTEEGTTHGWVGATHGGRARRMQLTLPIRPPLGYHDLTVTFQGAGIRETATQRLIVVPSQCTPPETRMRGHRGFGITTNLYTVRSAGNWGAGDFGDLGTLSEWVAHQGGAFVGMNPLHALRNEGYDVSPYSPITRLFRNPIYLRADHIPEFAHDEWARAHVASTEFRESLHELREATMLDYGRIMALRAPVLESLHRTFMAREADGRSHRARAYAMYREREDPQLTQYATFMAIAEREGPDARLWPEELRAARSDAVARMREQLADRVDYHRWLQFEIDRQLGHAALDASRAGLSLGLYQDLAVGSSASGSDVWANPELFRQGATVGAPPDMYSDEGQNWGLPAIDPHVLRETGYDYWVRLLRAGFRHTGALRIDHALGLFRMFWVPLGHSARDGAYVTSYVDELFGILALESVRHNAVVVGEDLGTVPPEVPKVLDKWGVLGSKVQVFERDFHTGRFSRAEEYRRMALATVNTHDLPPLIGWMEGRDIMLRAELGDLSDPAQANSMREMRWIERVALVESLIDEGILPETARENVSSDDLIAGVHTFIRRTPSALVGLSLDDLAHETTPVNIPGIWQDRYASWSRRMRETLEELLENPRTERALGT